MSLEWPGCNFTSFRHLISLSLQTRKWFGFCSTLFRTPEGPRTMCISHSMNHGWHIWILSSWKSHLASGSLGHPEMKITPTTDRPPRQQATRRQSIAVQKAQRAELCSLLLFKKRLPGNHRQQCSKTSVSLWCVKCCWSNRKQQADHRETTTKWAHLTPPDLQP